MHVTLVIPAYNEEKRLDPFLQSISTYLVHHPTVLQEIIVVDDGSTDRTYTVAARWLKSIPGLHIIKHGVNQGKGAAVRSGILAAAGEYVVFMDADGATAITELPKMMEALREADVAVGNRWMPGAKTARHSALRRVAGWVYRTYMRLFGLGKIDTMCGFKGYRREIAHVLFTKLLEPRWLFDTEVAYKATQRGYRIRNFPIQWESKDGSKLSTSTLLKTAFRIWPLLWRIKQQETRRE